MDTTVVLSTVVACVAETWNQALVSFWNVTLTVLLISVLFVMFLTRTVMFITID